MMPSAILPQIDRNGSPFLSNGLARWNGDVTEFKQPDWLIKMLGETNVLPILLHGIVTLPPRPGEINNFTFDFFGLKSVNIVNGSAVLTKMKTRIECRKYKCQPNDYYGIIITQRQFGKTPYQRREYMNYDPIDAQFPDCEMDCQERAKWVVDKVNNDPYRLATATLVTEGSGAAATYSVDVEINTPGAYFDQSVQGFTQPDVLVANARQSYTTKMLRQWYGTDVVDSSVADDKTYTVAEVLVREEIIEPNYNSSSNSSPYGIIVHRLSLGAILFDESDPESLAALNEFKAIVDFQKSPALYFSKLFTTNSAPVVVYNFTIARTDAGDPAAYNTAKTAYASANVVAFDRAAIQDGKSYYVLRSKANNQPAAQGTDVVEPGSFGADDTPCLDCE